MQDSDATTGLPSEIAIADDVEIISECVLKPENESSELTDPDDEHESGEEDESGQEEELQGLAETSGREKLLLRLNETTLMRLLLYRRPRDAEWLDDARKQQVIAILQAIIPKAIKKHTDAKEKDRSLAWVQRFPTFNVVYRVTTDSVGFALQSTRSNSNPYTSNVIVKHLFHVLPLPTQASLTSMDSHLMQYGFTLHTDALKLPAKKLTLDQFLTR